MPFRWKLQTFEKIQTSVHICAHIFFFLFLTVKYFFTAQNYCYYWTKIVFTGQSIVIYWTVMFYTGQKSLIYYCGKTPSDVNRKFKFPAKKCKYALLLLGLYYTGGYLELT